MMQQRKKVAVSACLLGNPCRYDGTDRKDETLLSLLKDADIIPFCPEDHCFGTPRPTIDLVETEAGTRAISSRQGQDVTFAIEGYADAFFEAHQDIALFIGKDRSPSCGVCSATVWDTQGNLLRIDAAGVMAKRAIERGIEAIDAEEFVKEKSRCD